MVRLLWRASWEISSCLVHGPPDVCVAGSLETTGTDSAEKPEVREITVVRVVTQ
jgi:hypothetical protein